MTNQARGAVLSGTEAAAAVQRVAREVFGYDTLRPAQQEAMVSLLGGHDVLLVMPTGSGKSAVYQVPSLVLDGPTVVISPLIALQRDQVDSLRRLGSRTQAHAVSSAVTAGRREAAWQALGDGSATFLFLAPEQLANPEVLAKVKDLAPTLVAVDEAHAVSAWGHDFRPDYLRLGEFIDAIGHPRVVALTATASPPVREDIVERLRMRDPAVVVHGFARPNIALEVVRLQSDADKREAVFLRAMTEAKPAVVFTATRRDSEEYAAGIAELGMRAAAYHGGMRTADRNQVQRAFMADELDVIVATNAFGMGVDKPDIRTVVHATIPDSPDSYYQEAGRSGRDGGPALAILYYRPQDLGLRTFFASGVPDLQDVVAVATAMARGLGDASTPAGRRAVAETCGLGPRKTARIINLLSEVDEELSGDPVRTAEAAIAVAECYRRLERSRIEMMRGYAETTGCRRQFLLAYFGEQLVDPCGSCDTCDAGTAQTGMEQDAGDFPLQARVRHADFGEGVVMSYENEPDRMVVLFEESGYRTLAVDAVREQQLLQPA